MTDTGLPRVLMVAYHFPPLAGSSGIQRTLRFVQHLPRFGWQPMVLTADPRAYARTSDDLMGEVPADVVVERAFALDTARHLSLAGRYVGAMARPDRWVSWRPFAVRAGLGLVRRYRPRLLWSTYPIATAHLIGADLQRRTGLPWVADFRDPMAQPGYPEDPLTRARYEAIEREAIERAALCIFATPGAAREYRRRYPHAAERIVVIENGYDEDSFAGCEEMAAAGPLNPGCTTLLHSGIVYPSERDPTQLFEAVARLAAQSPDMARTLRLRFRACAHDDLLHALADRFGIRALIEILPPLPYREALAEMMRADGLLVLQASNCNDQVPAKVYEYLRTGRPVLGLTDLAGDTAHTLRMAGIEAIAPLDKAEEITGLLAAFVHGQAPPAVASPPAIAAASRAGRTGELAQWLSRIVVGEPAV